MREFMMGVMIVLAVLVALTLFLAGVLAFCRWRIRKIEEELERIEPGSVANLKAAKACKDFAKRLREED